jgi:hypothetical protein
LAKKEKRVHFDFNQIIEHSGDDDCSACRAQDIAAAFLMPAVSAWEISHNLPRFSLAIHGASGLLGAMLEEGIERAEIEAALSQLLDDIERQIEEDKVLGGPPQGSA